MEEAFVVEYTESCVCGQVVMCFLSEAASLLPSLKDGSVHATVSTHVPDIVIGARLSEPHINGTSVHEFYSMYVLWYVRYKKYMPCMALWT